MTTSGILAAFGFGAGAATPAGTYQSRPTSSFGYYHGGAGPEAPLAYGQGSNQGQANYGVGTFNQGSGPVSGPPAWQPDIGYLFAFVVVELIAFGCLSQVLGRFGG
jgi:hypothetical protein